MKLRVSRSLGFLVLAALPRSWLVTSESVTRSSVESDGSIGPVLGEETVWQSSDGIDPAPFMPGVTILIPEEFARISKIRVRLNKAVGCNFTEALAAWDRDGHLILATIDNFFSDRLIDRVRETALDKGNRWEVMYDSMTAHTKGEVSQELMPGPPAPVEAPNITNGAKGEAFPGSRADLRSPIQLVSQCLRPVLAVLDPGFDISGSPDGRTIFRTSAGLIHPLDSPDRLWYDLHRIPHNDVEWDMGARADGTLFQVYASVMSLTTAFNESGTGMWMERSTGLSFLDTTHKNQLKNLFDPRAKTRLHPELDVRVEIPDPSPSAKTENAWLRCIAIALLKYNRYAIYDGRRLHYQYVNEADHARLSRDPSKGRLTLNSFYWYNPKAGGRPSPRWP
jgi:hypothetical protein